MSPKTKTLIEKVKAEIMRSAAILRPEELCVSVEAVIEHATRPISSLEAMGEDKLAELLARLEGLAHPDAEMLADGLRLNLFIRAAIDAADTIRSLITRLQAAEAKAQAYAGHVEQLVGLLEMLKDHWVDYDHVFSISVHEARSALSGAST